MAEPMKIRAQLSGDLLNIKILMGHIMETGQRKDPRTGQITPAGNSGDRLQFAALSPLAYSLYLPSTLSRSSRCEESHDAIGEAIAG